MRAAGSVSSVEALRRRSSENDSKTRACASPSKARFGCATTAGSARGSSRFARHFRTRNVVPLVPDTGVVLTGDRHAPRAHLRAFERDSKQRARLVDRVLNV